MKATMDGRDLIGTRSMDGAAIAAAVMNKVTRVVRGWSGGPRAATTAALMTNVVEQIYEYDDPGILNGLE